MKLKYVVFRVEVRDRCLDRPRTGEEGPHDLDEEAPGHGMLGVLSMDIASVVKQVRPSS